MRVHRKASKLALLAAMTCCFGSIQMTTVWAAEPPAIPTVDLNAPIFTPSVPEEKKFDFTFNKFKLHDNMQKDQWKIYKNLRDQGETNLEAYWNATENHDRETNPTEAEKAGIKNFVDAIDDVDIELDEYSLSKRRSYYLKDNTMLTVHIASDDERFSYTGDWLFDAKFRLEEYKGSRNSVLHLEQHPFKNHTYNSGSDIRGINMNFTQSIKIEPTLYITYEQNGNNDSFQSTGIYFSPSGIPGDRTVRFDANDVYIDMKSFNDFAVGVSPGEHIDRITSRAIYLKGGGSGTRNISTIFEVDNLTMRTLTRQKSGGATITSGTTPGANALVDFHVKGNLNLLAASISGTSDSEGLIIENIKNNENNLVNVTIDKNTNIQTSVFSPQKNVSSYGAKITNPLGGKVNIDFKGDLSVSTFLPTSGEKNSRAVGLHIGDDFRNFSKKPYYTYDPTTSPQGSTQITIEQNLLINLLGSNTTGISFRDTGKTTTNFTVKGTASIFGRLNENGANGSRMYGLYSYPGTNRLLFIDVERDIHETPTAQNEHIINNVTFEKGLLIDLRDNTTSASSYGFYHYGKQRNFNIHYLIKNAPLDVFVQSKGRDVYGILAWGENSGSFDIESTHGATIIAKTPDAESNSGIGGIYLESIENNTTDRNVKVHLEGPTTIITYKNETPGGGNVSEISGNRTHVAVNTLEQNFTVIAAGDIIAQNSGLNDFHFTSNNSAFYGTSKVSTGGINKITLKNGAIWKGHGEFDIPERSTTSFSRRFAAPRMMLLAAAEPLSDDAIRNRVANENVELNRSYYQRAQSIQQDENNEYGFNELLMTDGTFTPQATSEHTLITTTKDSVIDMRETSDSISGSDSTTPFGFLTTQRLNASGGILKLDIDVQSMESDKLLVLNEFTGNMKLDIHEINDHRPNANDQETGVGLVLARTKGEGTLTAHDREGSLFHTHYELGHMASQLQGENIPTFDTDWYLLRRTRLDPGENPTTPVDTTTGMHGATYLAYRNDLDKLLQRMGELRQHAPDTEGLWFRMKQGTLAYDGLFNSDNSYHSYELGYDKKAYFLTEEALKMGYDPSEVDEETMDPKLIEKRRYRGLSLAYTKGSISHDHLLTADISNTNPIIGHGTTRGRSLSLYQVDEYTNGVYVDAIARYSLWDTDMRTPNAEGEIIRGDFDQRGLTLSVEYGRKHKRHEKDKEDPTKEKESDWYLEPQAQLVWGRLCGTSYTLSNGIHVKASSMNSFIGRLGFNLGKEFDNKKGIVYGKLNFLHDFGGKYKATYTDENDVVNINHKFGGSWWQYGLGVSYKFKENMYVYGDVEKNTGHNYHSGWLWNIGIRYMY